MTLDQFRKVALSLPGVEERAHMAHPDFRVAGKIFATLEYPDQEWGMVALTPEQQEDYVQSHPDVFVPAAGVWDAAAQRWFDSKPPTSRRSAAR